MNANVVDEQALTERRRVAAAALAANTGLVPAHGDLVVVVAGGEDVEAGSVAYARHGFVVVRCGDTRLRAFDVAVYRQVGRMWEAEAAPV